MWDDDIVARILEKVSRFAHTQRSYRESQTQQVDWKTGSGQGQWAALYFTESGALIIFQHRSLQL